MLTSAAYCRQCFFAELKPAGALLYSTYLGGSSPTQGGSLVADSMGNIYVTGSYSPPVTAAFARPVEFLVAFDFPPAPVPFIQFGAVGRPGENLTFLTAIQRLPASSEPRIACVANAASLLGGAVSRGEIVQISGYRIGPTQTTSAQFDSNGLLPTSLAGTQLLVDGIAAPLLKVGPGTIEAIVPAASSGVFSPQIELQVITAAGTSNLFPVGVVDAEPGIFTVDGSGNGAAAVLNQDGTLNSPTNPAAVGSIIAIFCTGLGSVLNPPADGALLSNSPLILALPVTVGFGNNPIYVATVDYAGGAPDQVFGVFQVNVTVPAGTPAGPAIALYMGTFGVSIPADRAGVLPPTVAIK